MRKAVALAAFLGLFLGACSVQQEQVACQVDSTLQPVAISVLAAAGGAAGATAAAADTLVVHPLVVAYCQSLGGVPVVTTAPMAAPATPAPAVTVTVPAATVTVSP